MSDSVTVVIPWRDTGCTFRRRNLRAIRANVEALGWPVILADDPSHADFNLSAARNRGVEQADTDIVVIMDADVLVPTYYLTTAVRDVGRVGGAHWPYRIVLYLDEQGSQNRLAGKEIRPAHIKIKERNGHGGCVAVRRADYLAAGGYDEEFTGWGYEDLEWFRRASATIGTHWGVGEAHHLWHPRPKRDARTAANLARVKALTSPKRAGTAFAIIPTHTHPATLDTLIQRAGMPCIIVHTSPDSTDIEGQINLRDDGGDVNIQRWWNLGIREAERRGAEVVVLANHDIVPADDKQLPHMVDRLRDTGATIAMYGRSDVEPEIVHPGKIRRTGHAFALNLRHGIRPDERFRWYYGDTFMELQARLQGAGVIGVKADIAHRKAKGPRYPEAFKAIVAADHELYGAESERLMALPDIVYRVRPGDNNDELRYSLRSVAANLPHRRVWMIGHKPTWTSDLVRHIPGDRFPGKWSAIYDNVIRACEHPDISEDFLLVDDDVYVLQQIDAMPMWHLGSLQERLDGVTKNRGPDGDWQATLRATLDYLRTKGVDEPLSYEVHAPILINKATALPLLREAWSPDIHVQARSIYGNLANVGGTRHPDTKVVQGRKLKTEDVLSTTDASLRNLRHILESRFAKPCRYEVSE